MKPAKVLFIYDSKVEAAKSFVESLRQALSDFDIQTVPSGVSALLQARKYPIVHVFAPATSRNATLKKGAGRYVIQTMLAPARPSEIQSVIFGDTVVVFSKQDQAAIKESSPKTDVHCIPPSVSLLPATSLTPANKIREKYDVRERLLALALNDVCDEQHFDAFLYIMREYNRRDGFRLLMPNYNRDKQTLLWRKRVQETIHNEKLSSTILLDASTDLHSLIDGCDVVIDTRKQRDREFDFPLSAMEALMRGKPLLCFNIPPLNEALHSYRPLWVCNTNEDYVRESKDLLKEARNLEQIGTDIARLARDRYGAEAVAKAYRNLYMTVGEVSK